MLLIPLLGWLVSTAVPPAERRPHVSSEVAVWLAARDEGAADGRLPVVVLMRSGSGQDARKAPGTAIAAAGDVLPEESSIRRLESAPAFTARLTRPALRALAARADVAAITAARLLYPADLAVATVPKATAGPAPEAPPIAPAGQVGPAHIGADRLNALGVDGTARAIAIVDSGIDALHPDLGGAPIPNAKVWGGWNAAEDSPDVTDCGGHGTAAAGVAAGPNGVAPGAGIVALKVFRTLTGCASASLGDVLLAVDWAIAHRQELSIDAISLSLSDGSSWTGFCDAEEQASAAVFAAAQQAGIAVVAAAGNAGRRDGVAFPACLSSVAGAGMVYSAASGSVSWAEPACRDDFTGPDVVPCASNSGRALSLLAPGVRWLTQVPGGGYTSSFSGTSASAPAAAAAAVLARQVRPEPDPATTFDLLRTTGAPIIDRKNGLTTPRLDLSASLDATDIATGPCHPEGPDVVCETRAAALTGKVSTLVAALSLDRPVAGPVRLSLTGPSGRTVVLADGPAPAAFRDVYGRTAEPLEALSKFTGEEPSGLWKLRLTAGPDLSVVSWGIHIEPEAPVPSTPGGETRLLLPSAARIAGRNGAFFTTDVSLLNTSPENRDVALRFGHPEDQREVHVSLAPFGSRELADVIGNAFRTSGYGPLLIDASGDVLVLARARSSARRGGRRQIGIPVRPPGQGIGVSSGAATLLPPTGPELRLNLGFTEVSGAEVEVEARVRDAGGAVKGSLRQRVTANALVQLNDVYGLLGADADAGDRVEVEAVSGEGRVLPFAIALDNRSNDGVFAAPSVAREDARFATGPLVPGGHAPPTDLKLSNAGTGPLRLLLDYVPGAGPGIRPLVVPLGTGESRVFPDAVRELFGRTGEEWGAIHVRALDGGRVFTSASLSTATGVTVLPAGDEAHAGELVSVLPIERNAAMRTGLVVVETSGSATQVRVVARDPEGRQLAAFEEVLASEEVLDLPDLFARLGIAGDARGSATVEVLSGGAAAVYAVSVDLRTGDAFITSGQKRTE